MVDIMLYQKHKFDFANLWYNDAQSRNQQTGIT